MDIVAVQVDSQWEDRAGTHARVRRLLEREDVPQGALVVLPEMFDTGFSMDAGKTDPGAESSSERFCRELAEQKKVAVLAGIVARAGEGKLANEAVAWAADGHELARYRKMQPFTGSQEQVHYQRGKSRVIFEWQGVKISPFICYDLRFPEVFRPVAREVELMIVIASWPAIRSEHWVRLLQARAIENMCYVLGVNRCGGDPNFRYDGRSSLIDPQGNEIFQLGEQEQMRVAAIDMEKVRGWRAQFPALRDIHYL